MARVFIGLHRTVLVPRAAVQPSFHHEQGRFLAAAVQYSPALPHQPSSRRSQRCCAWPSPASVSAASMPPSPARPAPAPSSLSAGCQGEEALSLTENSSERRSPPAVWREGRAPFSYSSAFLCWEMDCQLLLSATLARRVAHRFQIPPRGGSAIGVGDINPTQVSFLRE